MMNLKNLKNSLPFLIGIILGLYFITLNITGKNLSHFPGDLGDGRFNTYILEHAHKFFIGQEESLWQAPFMHPEPEVITYSDNLVGTAPFYSIFRFLGLDREASFQSWFLLIIVLNFTCCYFFLNWLFKNKYAAVLGAMVFAFSMGLQSQMTHAQMFTRFPVPLAFWAALFFNKEFKPKYFFAAVFLVVYQLYCGIYMGLMLIIPIATMLFFALINKPNLLLTKIKDIKWIAKVIASLALNLLIALPILIPYSERTKTLSLHSYESVFLSLPTIKSFFFSQSGSLFWEFLVEASQSYPAWWDHQIFVGGVAMLAMLVFLVLFFIQVINKNKFENATVNSSIVILVLSGLITFLVFLRIGDFSFYQFVYKLPGFGSLRSLTRIINIELIFFAIATAFVFSTVLRKQNFLSALLFVLFAGLITADNYYKEEATYRTEKTLSQSRVNKLIEKMKNIPPGSIVSHEPEITEHYSFVYQLDAMLAAQSLNLKAVNGYSSTSPYSYTPFWMEMNSQARENWFKSVEFVPDTVYVIP
ncbi:MAG: hypothetical protein M3Q58_08255 [Bacteroidota bacterium]|nr:hypothetical protein [Bacteroidota bacterium]